MKIGIIGYGNIGKMIHQRLSLNPEFSFLIGGKEAGRNLQVAKESDILFLCLKKAQAISVMDEIRSTAKIPVFLTSITGPWPFTIGTEQFLLVPTVYGNLGKGIHILLGKPCSESPSLLINALRKHLGTIREVSDFETLQQLFEFGIAPALIAHLAIRHGGDAYSIPDSDLEKIAVIFKTGLAQIKYHLPLVVGLKNYFGSFEAIISFVATKGGLTERLLKEI